MRDIIRDRAQFRHQRFRIARHGVEAGDQRIDFAAVVVQRNAARVIPRGNAVRRRSHALNPAHHAAREYPCAQDAQRKHRRSASPERIHDPVQILIRRMLIEPDHQHVAVRKTLPRKTDAASTRILHVTVMKTRGAVRVIESAETLPVRLDGGRAGNNPPVPVQKQGN